MSESHKTFVSCHSGLTATKTLKHEEFVTPNHFRETLQLNVLPTSSTSKTSVETFISTKQVSYAWSCGFVQTWYQGCRDE